MKNPRLILVFGAALILLVVSITLNVSLFLNRSNEKTLPTVQNQATSPSPGRSGLNAGSLPAEKDIPPEVRNKMEALGKSPAWLELVRKNQANEPLSPEDMGLMQQMMHLQSESFKEPKLFKTKTNPPKTPEEKALWEWFRKKEQFDPGWMYQRPVAFYGLVKDVSGTPVANATIEANVQAPDGDKLVTYISGPDGSIIIEGLTGKSLRISILKEGYLSANGNYKYAEFYDDEFYVADPKHPVNFTLKPRKK